MTTKNVTSLYEEEVEAVGKLILKGVWFSDAVQIVHIVLRPIESMVHFSDGQFERDVNNYVDRSGKRVPTPTYKNIF